MTTTNISDYIFSCGIYNEKQIKSCAIHTMDTFNGANPNLISKKVLNDLEKTLTLPEQKNKVINSIGVFYSTYISPNMFPIIMMSFFCVYLIIKYILKKDKDLKQKKQKKEIKKIKPIKPMYENDDISDLISDDYLIDI
jgi:hypothetical protein